ncbi:MAG: DNA-3-methyladenine glycosylase I [Longispora sp.]|nr:DNA-3-methyladenine glycosylase I [Longispora sp. (in: high G+C Gram-positive bacteria)]
MSSLVIGPDGLARCPWAFSAPEYLDYHDTEWGRPLHGDDPMYERLTLEAFQSGLSWITILRKRPAFRAAFAGFEIKRVAEFTDTDIERLLNDKNIVRNRAKITAAVANARAACDLPDGLSAFLWQHTVTRPRPATFADVPTKSPESITLAKELKKHGFTFVGPTTTYALMQATGIVDDHPVGCLEPARGLKY